jgi:hypothetical protein
VSDVFFFFFFFLRAFMYRATWGVFQQGLISIAFMPCVVLILDVWSCKQPAVIEMDVPEASRAARRAAMQTERPQGLKRVLVRGAGDGDDESADEAVQLPRPPSLMGQQPPAKRAKVQW